MISIYGTGETRASVRLEDDDDPLLRREDAGADDISAMFPMLARAERVVASCVDGPPEGSVETTLGSRVQRAGDGAFAGVFMLQRAKPLGNMFVKVNRNSLVVPPAGSYYMWELYEGLTRQTALLMVALSIIAAGRILFPDEFVANAIFKQVLSGQINWALLMMVPFYWAFALVSAIKATRVGRLGALQTLASVRGYHFYMSYHVSGQTLAQSLVSALSFNGCNCWCAEHQLVNAQQSYQQRVNAASNACFMMLIVTPEFLDDLSCCVELLVALSRDPRHSIIYIDPAATWKKCALDGHGMSGSDLQARIGAYLLGKGCVVVRTLNKLVAVLDETLICDDQHHSEWWFAMELQPRMGLIERGSTCKVTLCRSEWYSLNLAGTFSLPAGAVSSGLHFISSDGRSGGPLFAIPMPAMLCSVAAGVGLYGFIYPWLAGIAPYFSQWQVYFLLSLGAMRSLVRCSDCRFGHSSELLPLFLAQHELTHELHGRTSSSEAAPDSEPIQIEMSRVASVPHSAVHSRQIVFASNGTYADSNQRVAALTEFLCTLQIPVGQVSLDGLEQLRDYSLYVIVVDSVAAAEVYLERFAPLAGAAGASAAVAQQLLVVDEGAILGGGEAQAAELVEKLRHFTAVYAGEKGFASLFFEALGIKLVSFLRCKDSSNARELTLQQRGRLEV
jgi:hypothetical protein